MATNETIKVIDKYSEVKEWKLLDYSLKKQPIITVKKGLNANGLAIDEPNQLIYMIIYTDHGFYSIQIVTFDGNFITSFGNYMLGQPNAIAVTEDCVFVLDLALFTVFQFSDFKISEIDTSAAEEESLSSPCGICIDYNGDLYVADTYNHRICVYSIDLKFLSCFGHQELHDPQDVTTTHSTIVVLDFGPNCVHFYSRNGDLLHSCVSNGPDDLVYYPTVFCLDPAGFILIADYCRHNIKILSPTGQIIHAIGRRGHGKGEFVRPQVQSRNFPTYGYQPQSRKINFDCLKDYIKEKKEEIKIHFKVYYDTLKETESMLLGDLDAILDIISKEKEKEQRQLKEITATQQFMKEQLKTSENEMLRKHYISLAIDIQKLCKKASEFSEVKIEWKHLGLCEIINEVCDITYPNTTRYYNNREVIMSAAPGFPECSHWDCCYDKNDNMIYLLTTMQDNTGYTTLIYTFDQKLNLLSTGEIPNNSGYWSPWITTSQDYIFITAGVNCEDFVMRISKSNYSNANIKSLDIVPTKSVVLGGYLFSTSDVSAVLYKFRIKDLNKEKDVTLTGCRRDGTNIDFSYGRDIHLRDSEFYILFNSRTLRAVCSFSEKGALLREIVTNPRRLTNPTHFCMDNDNNIIIADRGKIIIFDSYGRPIGSFEMVSLVLNLLLIILSLIT
ncbi:Cell surface protein [Oopsacas minuta]|uniref:Cell surface protein n=1 Tax=Oopsacas minuta TaxID=111878 RepID=A0AAV7KLK1_9METZ|nr:Cell surface protein [Oopsacas minuta]